MPTKNKRHLTTAMFIGTGLFAATAAYVGITSASPTTPAPIAQQFQTPRPAVKAPRPQVDVVFVLDTTSSMSGMLEGAKRKIWSIANQVLEGNPRPDVRFGLVAYRDRGDAYVTKKVALTEDMDDVYASLRSFRAAGGGDFREHVNQGLHDAVHKMQWRRGQKVLRQIFLVGDAPAHEGRDGLHSNQIAKEAHEAGILINAIRCGSNRQTLVAWKTISSITGGLHASIRQDGAMVAMSTPMDDRLRDLNRQLSATILSTGDAPAKAAARRRATANASMGGFASAESAKYRAGSGMLDSTDLLQQMKRGKKLSSFAPTALPRRMAAMSPADRHLYIKRVSRRRARLKRKILKLAKARDGYLRGRGGKHTGSSFDGKVKQALKAQGKRAGIAYH